MTRDETIKAIKAALKKRSGKDWSVTGGRGTAWGWIAITAPPKRRTWHIVQTGEPFPPHPEAIYRGVSGVTPISRLNDGSVTSFETDPWANEAYKNGWPLDFNWYVNDPNQDDGHMSPDEQKELAQLLGKQTVHYQGVSIPDGSDYYEEYVARARGETPSVYGQQYWD